MPGGVSGSTVQEAAFLRSPASPFASSLGAHPQMLMPSHYQGAQSGEKGFNKRIFMKVLRIVFH